MANVTVYRLLDGHMEPDTVIDPSNIPSGDEKAGISGASGANPVVLNDDSRLTDARTPTSHGNGAHDSTFITATGVTYENLNSNGDVGSSASTVAAGDDARFPSTDQKAALAGTSGTAPSVTNKFVDDDDSRVLTTDQAAGVAAAPNAISASNPAADKTYVDGIVSGIDWQESVDHSIDYVKTDAGAPTGAPASGEKCLNTDEDKLYTESTGSWDGGAASSNGDRYIHKDTGTIVNGDAGTHTKSNKIYTYNGTTFDETVADEGMATWIEDEDLMYVFNGTDWVKFGSTVSHNNTSGLQGGTTNEYYHLTSSQHAAVQNTPDATNFFLTRSDAAKLPAIYSFSRDGGMGQSQTNLNTYLSGKRLVAVMPRAGYLVTSVLQSSSARSGGILDTKIQKNGTDITPTGLDLILDDTDTIKAYANVAYGTTNYDVAAGDEISVDVDTDGSWETSGGNEAVTQEVHAAFV